MRFILGVRKVRGGCAEGARGGAREVRGRCAEGVREVRGRCAEGARKVRGKCNANHLIGCGGDP